MIRLVNVELLPDSRVRFSFEGDRAGKFETTYIVGVRGIRRRVRELRGWGRVDVLDQGAEVELIIDHEFSRLIEPREPICFCGPIPEGM